MSELVRTYEEAVKIVVDLWIEKSFNDFDNQDIGEEGMLQNLLLSKSRQAQGEVDQDKIDRFKILLTQMLMSENKDSRLDVDYHPCDLLSFVCEACEISTSCLPVKSSTTINNKNQVISKFSYNGNVTTI